MDGLQHKRGDTEEQDSRRPFLRKDKTPKVPIPSHENAVSLVGLLQQDSILGLGLSDVGSRNDIMPPRSWDSEGMRPYILINKKSHEEDGVTWTCSASIVSMAYCTHACTSASSRSG